MEIFIKAENYQVLRVIETGDFEITTTNDKHEKLELNALAIKYLHCGLGLHEHNRIMGCKHIPIDEQARKILRSLPQDERWRSKVNTISRSKSLVLKAQDSEESEVDEEEMAMLVRKFKMMMNNKKFDRNKKFTSSRNTTCFRCGSKDHFIKDCPVQDGEKGKTKGKEQSKESKVYKPYFTKDNVKKAMLAAWGDTNSEEEEDQPLEETAHLCLMEKTDEAAKLKELESEVWFSYNQLKHLSKENLINTVLEIQEDLKELHRSKRQSDKALVTYKENSEWVDNMKFDIQYRFFSMFDDNKNLKETIENLKQDNILLNVELSLLKISADTLNSEVPPPTDYPNFEKLKHDLEDLKTDKARLEGELERARKGKQPIEYRVPDWITKAQTKNTEGLGFKNKFQKEKKYVNLPSSMVPIGRSRSHAIDNVFLVEGLKHNLLSISQFCDKDNSVSFTSNKCRIIQNDTRNIILEGTRKGNTYIVDLNEVPNSSLTCLSVIEDDPLLWHRRFGHASFSLLDKIRSKNLEEGLPYIKFLYDKVCEACAKGKQTRISFKSKKMKEQRRTGNQLIHLRSDHGTEFENSKFDEFCTEYGMDHNFSAPRTPQQNGVVERKNRSLEDMARIMLISSRLPRNIWAEADCDDDFKIGLVRKQNPDEEPASQQKQQVEIAEVTNPEANVELEMENTPGTPLQEHIDVHNVRPECGNT
ncbi:uncharacterized protein LOC110732131 [Chenopodium quinoa]|uniref:uncharacterized protein LOC110732131 n=1 Tax=Chenopodium quinoa TaxID=63459 RepID=UPI000B78AFAB|nr:uncharacterized protein LOC110732131 [Chenopodium quinoa]